MSKTLYNAFKATCEQYCNKPALIDHQNDITYTYSQLLENVGKLIYRFQNDCRLQPGDRVGILLGNQMEWAASFFALQAIGAVVVPLSYRLTANELYNIGKNCEISGIVTASEYQDQIDTLLPELKWSVFTDISAGSYAIQRWLEDDAPVSSSTLPKLTTDDLAVLVYTSGTTGNAKGVMLCHRNLLADADGNAQVIEANSNDVFVTASPLFHVFGLTNVMLTGLLSGATIILVKKFNPKTMLEVISTRGVTFLAAVPTMYQMMLSLLPNPAYDLSSLRVAHSGAAPMHEAVFHLVEEFFGAPVQEGYGQSEASSIVTSNPLHGIRKPSSIGMGIPGITVEIVDEDGQVLPPDEIGELRVSGDTVMLGYWQRPEATQRALRDGKLYTSDVGYKDEDGYIFLMGRRDDMINVGGAKVYPQEVEEALYQHPEVKACAVVGEASELYHQIVAAYIVPLDGKVLSSNELQRHCRTHLAEYKVPKAIYIVDEIPQGATGKILRHQLKPPSGSPAS